MKIIVKAVFFFSLGLVVLGYFFENYLDTNGKLYIGLGVAVFAFVFLPLFIYQRYKNRVGAFIDERMQQPKDISKKE